jgi:hypothetical protein
METGYRLIPAAELADQAVGCLCSLKRSSGVIALEVSRNGKRLCVAGIGDDGMVGANVYWYTRPEGMSYSRLHVGGLRGDTQMHDTWVSRFLRVGDVITVRVIEAAEASRARRQSKLTKPSATPAKAQKRTAKRKGR